MRIKSSGRMRKDRYDSTRLSIRAQVRTLESERKRERERERERGKREREGERE